MTSPPIPTVEFERSNFICSVAFLPDGKNIVGGGCDGQIRRWKAEDGRVVGSPMNPGVGVLIVVVSRDGKWVVGGMDNGLVAIWDSETHSELDAFEAHPYGSVTTMDVSPDRTGIATGSDDSTACVWSPSTCERSLGPLTHDNGVAAVKYSPDGRLLATATCELHSVRIYDSHGGRCLSILVEVDSFNQSLAWARNSKHLFALSEGRIKRLDVSAGKVLSEWPINTSVNCQGIVLASNGRFIAASLNASISFWDTTTQEQIGPVLEHGDILLSIALSSNYDLVISGIKSVTLWNLRDILPSPYCDDVPYEPETSPVAEESESLEETVKVLVTNVHGLRAQHESTQSKIAMLEETVKELRTGLTECQRRADQDKNMFNMAIESLRTELAATERESDMRFGRLRATVRELHAQLDDPHHNPVKRTTA